MSVERLTKVATEAAPIHAERTVKPSLASMRDAGYRLRIERHIEVEEKRKAEAMRRLQQVDEYSYPPVFSEADRKELEDLDVKEQQNRHFLEELSAESLEGLTDAQRLHRLAQHAERQTRARTIFLSIEEQREQIRRDAEEAAREPYRQEWRQKIQQADKAIELWRAEGVQTVEQANELHERVLECRVRTQQRIQETCVQGIEIFSRLAFQANEQQKTRLDVMDDQVPIDRLKALVAGLPSISAEGLSTDACEQVKKTLDEIQKVYPLESLFSWDQGRFEQAPRFAGILKQMEVLLAERRVLEADGSRLGEVLKDRGITAEDDIKRQPEVIEFFAKVEERKRAYRELDQHLEKQLEPYTETAYTIYHELLVPLNRALGAVARRPVQEAIQGFAEARAIYQGKEAVSLAQKWAIGEYESATGEYRERMYSVFFRGGGLAGEYEVASTLDRGVSVVLMQDLWRAVGRGLHGEGSDGPSTAQRVMLDKLAYIDLSEEQIDLLGGKDCPASWFLNPYRQTDSYVNPRFKELSEGKTSFYHQTLDRMGIGMADAVLGLDAIADAGFTDLIRGYGRVDAAKGSLAFYEQYAPAMQDDARKRKGIEAIAIEAARVRDSANMIERIKCAAPQLQAFDLDIITGLLREKTPQSEKILEQYLLSLAYVGIPTQAEAEKRVERLRALDLPMDYEWNHYFGSSGVESVYVNAVLGFDEEKQERWARVMRSLHLKAETHAAIRWCRSQPENGLAYLEALVPVQAELEPAKRPDLALEWLVRVTTDENGALIQERGTRQETVRRVVALTDTLAPNLVDFVRGQARLYHGSIENLEKTVETVKELPPLFVGLIDAVCYATCLTVDDMQRLVEVMKTVQMTTSDADTFAKALSGIKDLTRNWIGVPSPVRSVDAVQEILHCFVDAPPAVVEAVPDLIRVYSDNLQTFKETVRVLRPLSPETLKSLRGKDNYDFQGFMHLAGGTVAGLEVVGSTLEAAMKHPIWNELDRSLQQEMLLSLSSLPRERWETCLRLLKRLDQTPSQAIQRVKIQLARQMSVSADPEGVYEQVVDVFIRNNLPTVGKVYKVFEILHAKEVLDEKLSLGYLSPTLRSMRHHGRMKLITDDLLRIHLESGNEELRAYLQVMAEGADLPEVSTQDDLNALTEEQRQTWERFVKRLSILLEASQQRDKNSSAFRVSEKEGPEGLLRAYNAWKEGIGIRPNQTLKERLEELFLRPVGLASVTEAIAFMDDRKREADQRGRDLVRDSGGALTLQKGDLLKGFIDAYFPNVLQNGSVAQEFLGASADSDATPLDTDASMVLEQDLRKGVPGAVEASLAKNYGRVLMVFRPDAGWQDTTGSTDKEALRTSARKRNGSPIELFRTAHLDKDRHYGIRTGLAMTHATMLIVKESTPELLRNLKMEIVQNNQYLPIVDINGAVIFSPEEFDSYRERFAAGTKRAGLPTYEFHSAPDLREEITAVREEMRAVQPNIENMCEEILASVKEALKELSLASEDGVLDIVDTGSAGRMTGDPASTVDFDFRLRLDPIRFRKLYEIKNMIAQKLGGKPNPDSGRETTVRLIDVPLAHGKADIDIYCLPSTEVMMYESAQAIKDKFAQIETRYGPEVREEAAANIVFAKRLLKQANAYSKQDGGLRGTGVENWILSHHGSFVEAANAFLEAATDDRGGWLPYTDFRKRYAILDPGVESRTGNHEDFLDHLEPSAYGRLVSALQAWKTSKMAGT